MSCIAASVLRGRTKGSTTPLSPDTTTSAPRNRRQKRPGQQPPPRQPPAPGTRHQEEHGEAFEDQQQEEEQQQEEQQQWSRGGGKHNRDWSERKRVEDQHWTALNKCMRRSYISNAPQMEECYSHKRNADCQQHVMPDFILAGCFPSSPQRPSLLFSLTLMKALTVFQSGRLSMTVFASGIHAAHRPYELFLDPTDQPIKAELLTEAHCNWLRATNRVTHLDNLLPGVELSGGPFADCPCCAEVNKSVGPPVSIHGLIGFCCSHGVPLLGMFCNMRTPEQFAYYLLALAILMNFCTEFYIDFGCRLKITWARYVDAMGYPSEWKDARILVNWMHGASHDQRCQILNNGRFQPRAGWRYGEQYVLQSRLSQIALSKATGMLELLNKQLATIEQAGVFNGRQASDAYKASCLPASQPRATDAWKECPKTDGGRKAICYAYHEGTNVFVRPSTEAAMQDIRLQRAYCNREQCVVANTHRPGERTTVGRQLRVVYKYLRQRTLDKLRQAKAIHVQFDGCTCKKHGKVLVIRVTAAVPKEVAAGQHQRLTAQITDVLAIVPLPCATAEAHVKVIMRELERNGLQGVHIASMTADSASVNMGGHSGVIAQLSDVRMPGYWATSVAAVGRGEARMSKTGMNLNVKI
ncbi:hypothetical protein QJQ45_007302 [Haematococcus lacustris]|nr:hypothetical protein QJQ45_007302 [Haematococcus lacustris]